jgi:AcrR family transcriptional regulator
MTRTDLMKIAEFAKLAELPASTLRYYIREGLLPPPVKTGKTTAYYSKAHLERIDHIKKRIAKKESLSMIKKDISLRFPQSDDPESPDDRPSCRRNDIIRSATDLFLSKGYGETSIADIVNHAHMSKETFYVQFKNKEELLIACADKIFHAMYIDVWHEIRMEQDMVERLTKRGKAFLASYPKWIVMMNLVRGLSLSENPAFRTKLKEVLGEIIDPIICDLDRLQAEGRLRKNLDTRLAGYLALGMTEYAASLVHQGACSEKEIIDSLNDVFKWGLKK